MRKQQREGKGNSKLEQAQEKPKDRPANMHITAHKLCRLGGQKDQK